MKVGDLVTVGPAHEGTYIITSLHASDAFGTYPEAVMLVSLDDQSQPWAMDKKWIKLLSKA